MSRMPLTSKRMAGVNTAVIFNTILSALRNPGKLFCILSPVPKPATWAFREIGCCLQAWKIEYEVVIHEGEKMYRLANGARIVCRVSGRH